MALSVYLYLPNLIGYSRVILAFVAFYYMTTDPFLCFVTYVLSSFLDAIDGHAARMFNQSTKFGAVLDMVTDRCATTCYLIGLAVIYPSYAIVFQFLVALDIGSHWIHMFNSLSKGNESHKAISKDQNWFLRLYYTSRTVLFLMCSGNELFFAGLYTLYWADKGVLFANYYNELHALTWFLLFPTCFVKQCISVIQMIGACNEIVDREMQEKEKAKKAKKN
eukprot:Colp12_sorted_trinity150504_noHs@33295